jgi:hypothetical protein
LRPVLGGTAATIAVLGMPQEMMAFEEGHMMSDNQEAAASASSEAVDRLARRLYSDLIKLDPVEDDPEWSALPDIDRHLYRQLIEGLVGSPDWALAALPCRGELKRRTPWILPLLRDFLTAAVACGSLIIGFNVAQGRLGQQLVQFIDSASAEVQHHLTAAGGEHGQRTARSRD